MYPVMSEEKDYSKEERAILNRSLHEVITTLKQELKERFGLRCIGSGGSMPYDIQEIGVDFAYYQQVTIEEARELEIRATERFVEIINAHEGIRPYLRDYPWDYHRAAITISFRNGNGEYYSEGVRFIFQVHEKMYYFGPEKSPNDIDHMKEEPYEEAKQIINSTPSCLKPIVIKTTEKKKKWFGLF
jgi:hypothetical protein